MPKKPLKVQPARRVYKPKYPSFEDKNPLLHPETRPYPFNHKFIKWASTGGLASLLLFSGQELLGQASTDTLYNPFPLENARVPYQPVSFGTGLPERLKSAEAVQSIRRAFEASGIQLEEQVWLDDENIGVYLDGYSHEDEIGFLFIDYTNMDGSFIEYRYPPGRQKEVERSRKERYNLSYYAKNYTERREKKFLEFIENKNEFIKALTRYKPREIQKVYANKLSGLAPEKESEALFNTYYLQHDLDAYRENVNNLEDTLIREISQHIDGRFEDSVEKKILLGYTRSFKKPQNSTDAFYAKLSDEVSKLKQIESNQDFINHYFIFLEFLDYDNGSYRLNRDTNYQGLKLEIMEAYPLKKWLRHLGPLNEYHDQHFVSLSEARRIDQKNKEGTQFIALISLRDPLMVVGSGGRHLLNDSLRLEGEQLQKEQQALWKEYSWKNGMTDEILSKRRAEFKALQDRYSWDRMKDLPQSERDSLTNLRNEESKIITAKYKAMELLTDEERAAFQLKFDELNTRERAWQKARNEEIRLNTLRHLEEQVKLYIQWAKSQMGN